MTQHIVGRLLIAGLTALACDCGRRTPSVETECNAERAGEAEAIAATARSWNQLHDMFSRFAACDDGAVAEGFSESVTMLLADQWNQLSELAGITKSDAAFESFVLRHIDESVPDDRLRRIRLLADERCLPDLAALCERIRVRAISPQ